MKSIDIYVNEKLILNNQSKLSENINLEQKIKLALNFDDSVFKDSSNIYKKCLKHIMSELTYFFKIKNADELTIITTETSWNRKIKEFPSCEKYKYLFTIDDDQFIKLVQKFMPKIYQKLIKFNVYPTMYASQWFFTCFSNCLSFNVVVRIFDCYLLEGEKIIYRVALALFKLKENYLLKAKSFETLMEGMKSITNDIK